MKKKRVLLAISLIILAVTLSVGAAKLYTYEKWQTQELQRLAEEQEAELDRFAQKISLLENEVYSRVAYSEEGFNYLAIGNSITVHSKCEYWWDEIGMAASQREKDYFHLVTEYLKQHNEEVISYACNFSIWEIQSTDRTQTVSILKKYLSDELDLITIQLSENATDLSTFSADMTALIAYLQEACPLAQIILVDDFWSDEKSALKKQIAESVGIPYASLEDIREIEEYQCNMGTTVYGDDDVSHIVEHNGVAKHPGDKGMQAIANSIIDIWKKINQLS